MRRLLADPEVDAIYIATPHPSHAEWAIKAAEAGKHVLCEKPMGLTAFEADAMIHAARKAGTFLGEAFMYRLHPQTLKLVELVKSGAIGEVRMIRSSFGFAMPGFMPEHRLYANDLAGGGILDVGGYPVSMARLIAGAAVGQAFRRAGKGGRAPRISASPASTNGRRRCCIFQAASSPKSPAASRSTRTMCCASSAPRAASRSRISGSPAARRAAPARSTSSVRTAARRSRSRRDGWLYSFEADAAGEAILAGRQEFAWPGMGWADSLGNLRVLDKWRAAVGLEYGIEKPPRHASTRFPAASCSRRHGDPASAHIPGLTPPASVVALGFEDFRTFSSGAILLDAFFEAGGNLFDTGFVYGAGHTETLLGEWLGNRGVREQSVIIGKGAHSPLCYPDVIGKQLTQSLDRLQTDHVDIYFMHRDNPDVPVGEFVDAMDARGQGRPHPRTVRRLELDERAHGRGDRLCRANRQAEARRALQQFLAGRNAGADLAGLRHLLERRMEGLADGPADAELRLVEPGPRLLHRSRRARQDATMRSWCGSGTRRRISAAATARSSWRKGSARARSMSRSPMCWPSPSRRCR